MSVAGASAVPRGPGIVAGLPGEVRGLARLRKRGQATLDGGIRLVLSGRGAANAQASAQALVVAGADGLISWGTTAALSHALAPGDLLLAGAVRGHDGYHYRCDPHWLARIERLSTAARIRHGLIVECRAPLRDRSAKRVLHVQTEAVATDQESAAVARVAHANGLPFVAVRAVADDAGMVLSPVARATLDTDGGLRPGAMLKALAGRPSHVHAQLRSLKQLAVALRAAQRTLGGAGPALVQACGGGDRESAPAMTIR